MSLTTEWAVVRGCLVQEGYSVAAVQMSIQLSINAMASFTRHLSFNPVLQDGHLTVQCCLHCRDNKSSLSKAILRALTTKRNITLISPSIKASIYRAFLVSLITCKLNITYTMYVNEDQLLYNVRMCVAVQVSVTISMNTEDEA